MNILLLSPNFAPEKTGIGVSATECAQFIESFGHQVDVITCMPHYPEWKIHQEYRGKLRTKEKFSDQITVHRTWLYVPKRISTAGRLLHEFSFACGTALQSLFRPCELLISISPPLSASALLAVVARLRRKPYWCYIQDIQPDAAICLGMLKNPLLRKIARFLERFVYKNASNLLVLSEGMKRNLEDKGVPSKKILVLPLTVDVDALRNRSSSESIFRARYGLEDKFVVLFSGNIGIKHNPEILVECANLLKDEKEVFFAVVGEGAAKEALQKQISELSLSNISILPLCERELLGDMLQSADLLIVAQRKEVLDIVVPSKVVAYLTSERCIIASVHPDSEAARLLNNTNAGVVVAPEDADALANAILSLKKDPEKAQAIARRGLSLVRERFHYDVVRQTHYYPLFHCSESQASSDEDENSVNTMPAA